METDAPRIPTKQESQPQAKDDSKNPQEPSLAPQPPLDPLSTTEPKMKPQLKKYLIFLPILIIVGYIIFIAITYWNCSKATPEACAINKCEFSLTGFKLTSEMKDDCCGNEICETGEAYSVCAEDCPDCDDNNECTKDSYDYDKQECAHEQLVAPCYLRPLTLTPATSETNYQIRIELTASNFDYSKSEPNGEDIRFFDANNNPLNYWIEDWKSEGEVSTVWVRVPSPGTEKIYMYYGYPGTSSTSAAATVFEFFEGFDYGSETELTQVWSKNGNPTIELSEGIVTITSSGAGEHGGEHIFKNLGSAILLNNIVEVNVKRFSGYHSHMANIGYTTSGGGFISDGNCWAALRYSPSLDGSHIVFGSNRGSIASSPTDSFNTIKIYHRDGISYAFEPPDTKVAEYAWPGEAPPGDYVLLGGATTTSGDGKASYDWIRIRKFVSPEPSATMGDEKAATGSAAIKEAYE